VLPASCRSLRSRCRTLSLLRMLLLGAAVAAFAPSSSSVPLGCALPASGGRAAVSICATATISRQAPLPTGPDPYKLVASDLEHIKASIKKVLSDNKGGSGAISKNEVLTMAAREFMQRKGKSFRPMVVLLVGRATHPDFSIGNRHYKLGVIAEMIHTASLIHEDVLEEDETDTTQGTLVHQEVALDIGNKVCILAGDFLLAKAAVELSLLDHAAITEIIATGLESVCEGGMLSFERAGGSSGEGGGGGGGAGGGGGGGGGGGAGGGCGGLVSLSEHLHIMSRGTAQLIGNSCQCAAILSGHDHDSPTALACLEFGVGLAMAQELIAEADAMDGLVKKKRRAPKRWLAAGPVTPSTPLLVAAEQFPELAKVLSRGLRDESDAALALEMVERSGAVARTQELATEQAQVAVDSLGLLPPSDTRDALRVLCHKVLTGASIKP